MTVSVTTAGAIQDADGVTIFDPDSQGMIVARFQFPDCLNLTPGQMRGWWNTVESETVEQFRVWCIDPPAPTPPDADATTLSVNIPIPLNVFCDPGFDLADEVIPDVKEAAIMAMCHGRGDHGKCWDKNECLRKKRRRR